MDLNNHSTDELIKLLNESQKDLLRFSNYYRKINPNSKEFIICNKAMIASLKLFLMVGNVVHSRINKKFESILGINNLKNISK